MKPLFSVAVLLLVLNPAFAQQAGQTDSDPGQPDTAKSGLSQAEALAAAQDAEEQSSQDEEAQAQGQPSGSSNPTGQYPDAQPTLADQQNAPQSADVERNAAQQAANQTFDQPDGAPLPERRTLHVAQAPALLPRSEASAYPVYREHAQLSVGARLLSAKEVEQKFSTPLGKRFLVVEVGIFPAGEVTLRPQDFTIRIGDDTQAFFASTPEDVATDLALASHPRRVGVFPSVGVGYSSGPWGRGVSTGVGVGVAGGPRPYPRGPIGANRRVVENELRDKSLPAGSLMKPVAGYLYFPVKEKRDAHYNLEFTRNGQVLSLPLPGPKK